MAWRAAVAAAVALMAPISAGAQPAGQSKPPSQSKPASTGDGNDCFYINQLQSNQALNEHALIFRVNVNDFYELDFAQRCDALNYPNPRLILTPVGGIGLVCHAIDLDVKVGEQGFGSIPEACIPSALHRLTPAEVAAIPKKKLP